RLEETVTSAVLFRGKALDAVTETIDRGGIVRVLAPEGGWGTATFNDWDNLDRKVDEALACARAVPSDRVALADVAPAKAELGAKLSQDFRSVPPYNEVMRREPEVKSTMARYRDAVQTVYYGNSNGAWIVEERPLVDLGLSAQAVRGDDVQSAYEGLTIANEGFECILGKEESARSAAKMAHALLDAKPVKAGVYTVIADPKLSGVFVHEAFGHLSEADFAF